MIISVIIIVIVISLLVSKSRTKEKVVLRNQTLEETISETCNLTIDTSKSLFDRNSNIINRYVDKLDIVNGGYYHVQNLTRDCINEICLIENQPVVKQPGIKYLYAWKNTASQEWIDLANQIEELLGKIKHQYRKSFAEFETLDKNKISIEKFLKIVKQDSTKNIFISQINAILKIKTQCWKEIEELLIDKKFMPKLAIKFDSYFLPKEADKFNKKIEDYNYKTMLEIQNHEQISINIKKIKDEFNLGNKEAILKRVDYILNNIAFPDCFPKIWYSDYDVEQSIFILECKLPDVVHSPIYKCVELKTKTVDKSLTKKEKQEYAPQIHPAIILRIAYEIFSNDENGIIKLLVLNGWVEYDNPATGQRLKSYTSSLVCNRDQILALKLSNINTLTAFLNLNGKSAGVLVDIIPIAPSLSLDKKDKRFIATKEVLNKLENETNLASMDWQDFENLIAELFQKVFEEEGAEVKVTQSSRDRGVDAVIFNPDPIKGGKFVVQAKRYTKTVDVSAVRDLCAVVKKEGASRGILVTTSGYGADAYAFAQNEPITLLNGSELLGLLEKHGYKFRINIVEARKLMREIELNKK